MTDQMAYACEECHKVVKTTGQEMSDPECCGSPMKKIPLAECRKDPAFAEHARFSDDDDPCT